MMQDDFYLKNLQSFSVLLEREIRIKYMNEVLKNRPHWIRLAWVR
jgi:hypothetical protein